MLILHLKFGKSDPKKTKSELRTKRKDKNKNHENKRHAR